MMRLVRVLLVTALAGCAEVSGLSNLGVDDASTDGDVGTDAPSGLDAAPESSSDSSFADAGTTYCVVDASATQFCADFDENNILAAFVNGAPGSWTSASVPPPTLVTNVSASAPACASFDGTKTESLLWTMSNSAPGTIIVHASFRVDATAIESNAPASLVTDATHAVVVAITSASASSFSGEIDETTTLADGGVLLVQHPAQGNLATGGWVSFMLTVTSSTVALNINAIQVLSFNRAQNIALAKPALTVGFRGGWKGEVDNVSVNTK